MLITQTVFWDFLTMLLHYRSAGATWLFFSPADQMGNIFWTDNKDTATSWVRINIIGDAKAVIEADPPRPIVGQLIHLDRKFYKTEPKNSMEPGDFTITLNEAILRYMEFYPDHNPLQMEIALEIQERSA